MDILICDDDIYVRKMLMKITSENPLVSNITLAEDGLAAVNIARNKKFDIIYMDIDMPNMDGIEAARIITKLSPDTRFVFVTSHMEYAIDSFCVHPYDFLLKPIDIDKFKDTLSNLLALILGKPKTDGAEDEDTIFVKDGPDMYFLHLNEVLFFERIDRLVLVKTIDDEFTITKSLVELEELLNDNFFRTHKSFIVNKKYISKIRLTGNRTYEIEFHKTKRIAALSRHKYNELIEELSL